MYLAFEKITGVCVGFLNILLDVHISLVSATSCWLCEISDLPPQINSFHRFCVKKKHESMRI